MKELLGIDFLKEATKIEEILDGYSNSKKYTFYRENTKYFIKVGFNFDVSDVEEVLTFGKIPHCKVIEFGENLYHQKYIIEEYIDAYNLKSLFNKLDKNEIYEYGYKIGSKYGNLRKVYKDKTLDIETNKSYKEFIGSKIVSLEKLIENNNLIKYIDIFKLMKSMIQDNYFLLESCPMVFGNCDVKPSNFLVKDKKIYAIDIDHTDYKLVLDSLRFSLCRAEGDLEKHWVFFKGYLNGLYNSKIPDSILNSINYFFVLFLIDEIDDMYKDKNTKKVKCFLDYVFNLAFDKAFVIDKKILRA